MSKGIFSEGEKDWEEEFLDKFGYTIGEGLMKHNGYGITGSFDEVKQFISNLLSHQQNERIKKIREEIEGMKGGTQRLETMKNNNKRIVELVGFSIKGSILFQEVYEWCIDDVLAKLKEMEEE